MNCVELSYEELSTVEGGGFWGTTVSIVGGGIGAAIEGAEFGAVLGAPGAVAGAISFGLMGTRLAAVGAILGDNF